jgi:hypothetical protein
MSQEHTLHIPPEKKNGQKTENSAISALLSEVTGAMEGAVGMAAVNRAGIEDPTRPLTNTRLQTVQRQLVAKQVGRISGNRYMQQVFSAPNQVPAALPLIQRKASGWSDAIGASAETSLANDKVTPPADASWNAGKVLINNIWRIPIEGLTHGNTSDAENLGRRGSTSESAVGKAIVLQHKEFKEDKPTRVLLHLHGFGAGYRQLEHPVDLEKLLRKLKEDKAPSKRKAAKIKKIENQIKQKRDYAGVLQAGQARDVELYRMEQQLDALQDPQMMAVLPQGTSSSGFGDLAKKPAEYLDEALGKLKAKPTDYHIVLSGHSGAGPTVTRIANQLKDEQKAGQKNAQVDEMILFDAINSDVELESVESFLKTKIKTELSKIKAQPAGKEKNWIDANGFRFRGYHSGYKYHPKKKDDDGKMIIDTSRWAGYGWWYPELDKFIKKWFQDNTNDLSPDVRERLESNYQVFQVTNTSHEKLMGSTRAAEKGQTAPSKVGVLHEALSALSAQSPSAAGMAPTTVQPPTPTVGKAPSPVQSPVVTGKTPNPAIPEATAPQIENKKTKKENKKTKKAGKDAFSQAALSDEERARLPELREARQRYKVLDKKGKKLSNEEKTEKKELGEKLAGTRIFAKADMEDDIVAAGKTVQDWFNGIVPEATFMELPIGPSGASKVSGVHRELLDHLEMAEKNLMQLMDKAQGKTPAFSSKREYAEKIGLYSVNGLRLPSNATGGERPSMHCYGLAVDVNYKGNPFVGNNKKVAKTAPAVIKNATLLIEKEEMDVKEQPGKKGASEMWDRLNRESEALKIYLSLRKAENRKLLEAYVKKAGGTRTVEDWKELIEADYAAVRDEKRDKGRGDFEGHSNPAESGFMDLDKLLVEALTQAGLFWGGQYNGAKDIMHFDWRSGTIKH